MRTFPSLGLMSASVALLALAAPAQADQHEITAEAATAYFEQVRQEAIEIMQAQDFDRLLEWTERNIADGAVFQASVSIFHGEEQKGIAALTVDKDDMLRLSGMFVGAFRQQEIEDYSLEVDVGDVTAHGPGAATVRVMWRESATFDPAADGGGASGDAAAEGKLTVEQVADCRHLLQRQGDRLTIGLSTCTAEMRL